VSDHSEKLPAVPGKYEAAHRASRSPSVLTSAGQIDRREQAVHQLNLNHVERATAEAVAQEHRAMIEELAHWEREASVLREKKFHLHRAHKESRILADDALEAAEFALLDDDLFLKMRTHGQH
jgi:hypothetical protein